MVGMECKICLKKFCNGKALGGHMRSHYATLPLPPHRQELSTESLTESTSSSAAAENPKDPNESESARGRSAIEKGDDDDICTEEDVALCLVMLSRDGCRRRKSTSSDSVVTRRTYKSCEKCNKVFKSSQGLGSHRSTHYNKLIGKKKKKKNTTCTCSILNVVDHVHECEFCRRRFNSAQALGGHKRWHLLVSKNLVDINNHIINISSSSEDKNAFPLEV